MFITADILRKYGACGQGIRYIERFYPNGAEMIDIIRDRHINKEFLHWGREHLVITSEELAAYHAVCNIVNSEGFWYSEKVYDSKYVIKSKNVKQSQGIFNSADISNSTDIVDSDDIEKSQQVFHSSMVEKSNQICRSKNVSSSHNICNSTMIAWSANVIDSNNVFDSSEIIKSKGVIDSFFCQNCNNIEHCLFCENLDNAEYCIFNKPVGKSIFELISKQYKKYMNITLDFIRDWPKELVANVYVSPTRKFDDWYSSIPQKTWDWVRTLPNFDSMLLYNITMLPEILITEK